MIWVSDSFQPLLPRPLFLLRFLKSIKTETDINCWVGFFSSSNVKFKFELLKIWVLQKHMINREWLWIFMGKLYLVVTVSNLKLAYKNSFLILSLQWPAKETAHKRSTNIQWLKRKWDSCDLLISFLIPIFLFVSQWQSDERSFLFYASVRLKCEILLYSWIME